MTCEEAEVLMNKKIDHTLQAQEEQNLSSHLSHCPSCQALWSKLQQWEECVSQETTTVPPDLAQKIMAQVKETPQEAKRFHFPRQASLIAALLAIVLIPAILFSLPNMNLSKGANAEIKGDSKTEELLDLDSYSATITIYSQFDLSAYQEYVKSGTENIYILPLERADELLDALDKEKANYAHIIGDSTKPKVKVDYQYSK